MANKFIVFVVFAAAAQASLAASDIETAKATSRGEWGQVGETICKVVDDNSQSIEASKEEYRGHQRAGAVAFFGVAPFGSDPTLQNQATADSTTFREGLFKAVQDARTCENYKTAVAEIETNKNGLPYAKFVNDFVKFTAYTGPTDQAVDQLKNVYELLYAQAEKLAGSTCGGALTAACTVDDIHAAVSAITDTIYSWL